MRRLLLSGGVIAALTIGSVAPAAAIGTIVWDTSRAECRGVMKAFEGREFKSEHVIEIHEGIPQLSEEELAKLREFIENAKLRAQSGILRPADILACIGGTTIP